MTRIQPSKARLERARDDRENRMDLEAARAALKEKGPRIEWKRLKEELGLPD